MERYSVCGKIGEGSFSEVLKARCLAAPSSLPAAVASNVTGKYVALKCVKLGSAAGHRGAKAGAALLESKEVFALRMIKPHDNVIRVFDVFRDTPSRRLCIVTELMEMNLYEYLQSFRGKAIKEDLARILIWQALSALAHVHRSGFFHRDVKPENLLVCRETHKLKLADFGSCREIACRGPYTEYIATRWYRAPECLLTRGQYSLEMDLWSIGCVLYELLTATPLFPGKNEDHQLQCIQQVLGPLPFAFFHRYCGPALSATFPPVSRQQPSLRRFEDLLVHVSADCVNLIRKMLAYCPAARITAAAALQHPFFDPLRAPKPAKPLVNGTPVPLSPFDLNMNIAATTKETPEKATPRALNVDVRNLNEAVVAACRNKDDGAVKGRQQITPSSHCPSGFSFAQFTIPEQECTRHDAGQSTSGTLASLMTAATCPAIDAPDMLTAADRSKVMMENHAARPSLGSPPPQRKQDDGNSSASSSQETVPGLVSDLTVNEENNPQTRTDDAGEHSQLRETGAVNGIQSSTRQERRQSFVPSRNGWYIGGTQQHLGPGAAVASRVVPGNPAACCKFNSETNEQHMQFREQAPCHQPKVAARTQNATCLKNRKPALSKAALALFSPETNAHSELSHRNFQEPSRGPEQSHLQVRKRNSFYGFTIEQEKCEREIGLNACTSGKQHVKVKFSENYFNERCLEEPGHLPDLFAAGVTPGTNGTVDRSLANSGAAGQRAGHSQSCKKEERNSIASNKTSRSGARTPSYRPELKKAISSRRRAACFAATQQMAQPRQDNSLDKNGASAKSTEWLTADPLNSVTTNQNKCDWTMKRGDDRHLFLDGTDMLSASLSAASAVTALETISGTSSTSFDDTGPNGSLGHAFSGRGSRDPKKASRRFARVSLTSLIKQSLAEKSTGVPKFSRPSQRWLKPDTFSDPAIDDDSELALFDRSVTAIESTGKSLVDGNANKCKETEGVLMASSIRTSLRSLLTLGLRKTSKRKISVNNNLASRAGGI